MKSKSVFALIDCNNFFVSCERVFAPYLENKAIVVLSNNDGCAISRSNEAKALGIKMGEPFFKFKKLYEQGKVEVFSSNFELYSNMSWRVMESIRMLCPSIEIYSVDEAFLDFSKINPQEYITFAQDIKNKIMQWTGIPVSIGIASTKTLAKLANQMAKKGNGIFSLYDDTNINKTLEETPVEEIWGIGKNLAPKLRILGIGDALQLKNTDRNFIRKKFSIIVERIACELDGISCIDLISSHQAKKSITYSRSFGYLIKEIDELEKVLISYISKACEKLRKEHLLTQSICIAIRTNLFNKTPKYINSITIMLPYATNNPIDIIKFAKPAFNTIFKEGFNYQKLSILLLDFVAENIEQFQIFKKTDNTKSKKLMKAFDQINNTLGKNTVFLAGEGIAPNWQSKRNQRSSLYTTSWNELPIVK